jgi:hypothetical protein
VYDQPSYTIYDASLGVAKSNWSVQAYAQNLSDTRADLFSNDNQFESRSCRRLPSQIRKNGNARFLQSEPLVGKHFPTETCINEEQFLRLQETAQQERDRKKSAADSAAGRALKG